MGEPLISVCVPNLNTRPFLEERLDTLRHQTFKNIEIVISDNHSEDGAWEYFQSVAKLDSRIRIQQASRAGMYANWNNCIRESHGKYVYIATSDDTASPELLERLIEALEGQPDLGLAMCDYQHIDEHSRPIESALDDLKRAFYGQSMNAPSRRSGRSEFLAAVSFGAPMWVTMTSVLFRRSLLDKTGLFPVSRGSVGDFEWALRAYLHSDVAFVPGRLATWRMHSIQATQQAGSAESLYERLLRCVECVLADPGAPLPAHWRSVDAWQERLTGPCRARFRNVLLMDRSLIRHHPGRFAARVGRALRKDPSYTLGRILRGFPRESGMRENEAAATARELISVFGESEPGASTH